MKYLLTAINAKYIHSNPAVYLLKEAGGRDFEKDIEIAEYTINEYPDQILADMARHCPDYILISCYIWNWSYVCWLLKEIKKVLPETGLFLGGPEVSFNSRKILEQYPSVDGIFCGEGEISFRKFLEVCRESALSESTSQSSIASTDDYDILSHMTSPDNCDCGKDADSGDKCYLKDAGFGDKCYLKDAGFGDKCYLKDAGFGDNCCRQDTDFSLIPGLTGRRPDGSIFENPPAPVMDLDAVPFIYHDMKPFENKILYYESSRGCPFGCGYCLSSRESGMRLRSLPLVEKELQYFLDKKVPQVKFLDRTFNCSRSHAMAIWSYIKEHDNGITNFHFELEPDLLTDDELELITSLRPGQIQVEIGVQSTNEKTLAAVNRHTSFDKLKNCARTLLSAGNMHVHLDLIAGLPYEDFASFRKSFNDVYGMHPNELQLGFLKLLHGTPLENDAKKYGIVCLDSPPYEVLRTNWISYDEILRLKRIEEVLEIYYNSGQFSRTMRVLEHYFASPFDMYDALADYYDRNEYFVKTPARIRRYTILLDFIKEEICGMKDFSDNFIERKICSKMDSSGNFTSSKICNQTNSSDNFTSSKNYSENDMKDFADSLTAEKCDTGNQVKNHTKDFTDSFAAEKCSAGNFKCRPIPNDTAQKIIYIFEELLTFDVYLRENMKSRPPFAHQKARSKRNDSYHDELFHIPVTQIVPYGTEERITGDFDTCPEICLRFDYTKRNPVTKDAQYYE